MDNTAVVRPGDTLVIGIRNAVTDEEIQRFQTRFREEVGDVQVVLIENVTGFAVLRSADSDQE